MWMWTTKCALSCVCQQVCFPTCNDRHATMYIVSSLFRRACAHRLIHLCLTRYISPVFRKNVCFSFSFRTDISQNTCRNVYRNIEIEKMYKIPRLKSVESTNIKDKIIEEKFSKYKCKCQEKIVSSNYTVIVLKSSFPCGELIDIRIMQIMLWEKQR